MRIFSFIILISIFSFHLSAQSIKPGKPKAIKLKTFLGKNQNGATVTLDEAQQLINFPLRIVDMNNERCNLISYNFIYRRKAFLENEETGKKEIKFSTVGDRFNSTPLPQIWKDNLAESLKKDEELYFYDIIIKDKLGRRTFAPELKIRIQ